VRALQGWVTGWAPAFLLLIGRYNEYKTQRAIALATFGVIVCVGLYALPRPGKVPVEPGGEGRERVAARIRPQLGTRVPADRV
jgi:putative amide transporter protein